MIIAMYGLNCCSPCHLVSRFGVCPSNFGAMGDAPDPLKVWVGNLRHGLARGTLHQCLFRLRIEPLEVMVYHKNSGIATSAILVFETEGEALRAIGELDGLYQVEMQGYSTKPIAARPARKASTASSSASAPNPRFPATGLGDVGWVIRLPQRPPESANARPRAPSVPPPAWMVAAPVRRPPTGPPPQGLRAARPTQAPIKRQASRSPSPRRTAPTTSSRVRCGASPPTPPWRKHSATGAVASPPAAPKEEEAPFKVAAPSKVK